MHVHKTDLYIAIYSLSEHMCSPAKMELSRAGVIVLVAAQDPLLLLCESRWSLRPAPAHCDSAQTVQ